MEFLKFLNPEFLIKTFGLVGVFFIVFAESGLFFGFFFPGDSLLFTAGFFASQGFFGVETLVLLCTTGAILGDSVGYAFGKKVGVVLFQKEDSRFFKKKHLLRAHQFYEKHGGKAIVLARFVPIVRTFAPIVAGVAQMTYRKFIAYNVIGGTVWGFGVPLLGYFFGNLLPKDKVDTYFLPVVALIIFISILPIVIQILKDSFFLSNK